MNTANSKRFSVHNLDRTIDLYEEVEAHRWEINKAKENEKRLLCEFWVCKARAILEDPLSNDDQQACLWVLHVVTGIARASSIYIKGLPRAQPGFRVLDT